MVLGFVGAFLGGGGFGGFAFSFLGSLALSALLGPQKVEGSRRQDLDVQHPEPGEPLALILGTGPAKGHVSFVEGDQVREVIQRKSSGGFFGVGGVQTTTYTYFATFEINCAGS